MAYTVDLKSTGRIDHEGSTPSSPTKDKKDLAGHEMKKIWINRASSFRDAEKFEKENYLAMGASKRIEEMQLLREMYYKIKKRRGYEGRKRLRRVIRIIQ